MPAVADDDDKLSEVVAAEDDKDGDILMKDDESAPNSLDDELLEGLLDGFNPADGYCLEDILSLPNGRGRQDSIRIFSDI